MVKCLPSAQVMIPGSWDRDPHQAPCSAGSLPLPLPLPLPLLMLSPLLFLAKAKALGKQLSCTQNKGKLNYLQRPQHPRKVRSPPSVGQIQSHPGPRYLEDGNWCNFAYCWPGALTSGLHLECHPGWHSLRTTLCIASLRPPETLRPSLPPPGLGGFSVSSAHKSSSR